MTNENPGLDHVNASEQEIFDHVINFLRKQGRPSFDAGGNCVYATPEGLQCAAGCLFPLEEAALLNNGLSWTGLTRRKIVPWTAEKGDLIQRLQKAHDSFRAKVNKTAQDFEAPLVKKAFGEVLLKHPSIDGKSLQGWVDALEKEKT